MDSNQLKQKQQSNYIRATGRRKSSVAQIIIHSGTGEFEINNKSGMEYLQNRPELINIIQAPINFLKIQNEYDFVIRVMGGGLVGQSEAIRLGISRALCKFNDDYKKPLKLKKFLTCDARVKERKKYGLKKARKAPQYSKR